MATIYSPNVVTNGLQLCLERLHGQVVLVGTRRGSLILQVRWQPVPHQMQ